MDDTNAKTLDLVGNAETPLYSAFRRAIQQIESVPSLGDYLAGIDILLKEDVLRLWLVNPDSGVRTRLYAVPADAEDRYARFAGTDGTYDPLALSLTLGTNTPNDTMPPPWEVDIDLRAGEFTLYLRKGNFCEVLSQIALAYPDQRFSVTEESENRGCRVLRGILGPTGL